FCRFDRTNASWLLHSWLTSLTSSPTRARRSRRVTSTIPLNGALGFGLSTTPLLLLCATPCCDGKPHQPRILRHFHHVNDDAVEHALVGFDDDLRRGIARHRALEQVLQVRVLNRLTGDRDRPALRDRDDERLRSRVDVLRRTLG